MFYTNSSNGQCLQANGFDVRGAAESSDIYFMCDFFLRFTLLCCYHWKVVMNYVEEEESKRASASASIVLIFIIPL